MFRTILFALFAASAAAFSTPFGVGRSSTALFTANESGERVVGNDGITSSKMAGSVDVDDQATSRVTDPENAKNASEKTLEKVVHKLDDAASAISDKLSGDN